MNKIKIFNLLPYFLKILVFNIRTFLNYKKRFGGKHKEYLLEYKKLWYSDINTAKNFQRKQLTILLKECYEYSIWYNNKMKENNITLHEIETQPFIVLNKMPILTKSERKLYVDKILNTNIKRKTVVIDYTSGTSGTPTKNYLDKESVERNFAFWRRHLEVLGLKLGMKNIRFSGNLLINQKKENPPFWIYNFSEKQLFMSTYHLSEKYIRSYIGKIQRFKPKYIEGYPSAIFNVAKYILDNHLIINNELIAILVTAETLYDYQRETIEKAFNVNVINKYASSEGTPAITECVNGKLHLNIDAGVFEFLNFNDEVAKPGELARLIVTSFKNYKTPLIRYEIGDTVLLSKENIKCKCGCNFPVVEKIIGREEDMLLSENGSLIGMMIYKVFKYAKNISKGQIIQQSKKNVEINIEVEDNFNNTNKLFLISKIHEILGDSIMVDVNILNKIPLTKSGKFVAVKRNFKL